MIKFVADWRDFTEDLEEDGFEYGFMIQKDGKKYWVAYDEDGAWVSYNSLWKDSRKISEPFTDEEFAWIDNEVDYLSTQHDFV
jgi:hypothetical protein